MQTHCRFAHCEHNKQKQNKPQQVKIANKKTETIAPTKKKTNVTIYILIKPNAQKHIANKQFTIAHNTT